MPRRISAAIGLDRREKLFVQIIVASMDRDGNYDLSDPYRKAYGVERSDGAIVFPERDIDAMDGVHKRMALEEATELSADVVGRKAKQVFSRKAVQRYFEELTSMSSVAYAQMVIEESVRTGDPKERQKSAQQILDDRDKVSRREMTQEYWAITSEIGAQVVVPLPGEVSRVVMCPCGCKHEMEVSIPIQARFPGQQALSSRETPEGHIRVTTRDLQERRAYVELTAEAKIALAEMAGAPWSDVDPDAGLSELQRDALSRKERTKILHGGSGVGKSVLGGLEAAIDTWVPHNRVAVLGQSYENVSPEFDYVDKFYRAIFHGDESMFIRIANINRLNYHDFEVTPIWGSSCRGFSLGHEEGAVALGKSLDTAIIGEGAFVSTEVMNTKVRRALDRSLMLRPGFSPRETGKLVIFTTPNNVDGCAADIVQAAHRMTRKQMWKLHYGCAPYEESLWFREATVLDNPSYDPRIYYARKKEMEAQGRLDEFRMVYEGQMTQRTGLVYRNFDQERHLIPMPTLQHRRSMRYGLGVDTGTWKAFMLVGIDPDRVVYWLGEVKTERTLLMSSILEAQQMILERMPFEYPTIQAAMARIDLHVVDPASEVKLELEDGWPGLEISPPTREGGLFLLQPTVDVIDQMFSDDKLFIVEDMVYTIDEILNYRYKSKKSAVKRDAMSVGEIARENDHCLDAGRYITLPLRDLGPLEIEPTQLSLQEAFERQQQQDVFGELRKQLDDAEEAGGIWIGGLQ